jgi:hypothetical protein
MASEAPTPPAPEISKPAEIAARCHEIQTGLGLAEVPEFENLRSVGMAVRLALHIRGLPLLNYETLRLVATHYLGIPSVAVRTILEMLAEVEFIKLQTEGRTIKAVLPNVPYYETLYDTIGTHGMAVGFNEAESLSIDLLCRLSKAPEKVDTLRSHLGVDPAFLKRAFDVGKQGS